MSNISFVLFACNEEKRIGYAIRNFLSYGDVYVFDGGSTDKTKEICESLGAHFFSRPSREKAHVETQENFEFIKSKIITDWIYWGYVDNIAPKNLLEKLAEISTQEKIKMVLIPLYTYLWGNTEHCAHKGYSPMFFHKDFVDFSRNYIHGMGQFLGSSEQCLKLPNRSEFALHHFSTYDIAKFVKGHLRYAEEEASAKFNAGKKFGVIRMFAAMLRYCWIYRRSLKSGALGWIIMYCFAFSRFMTYAKLFELENGITLESIENNYSVSKKKMLEEFK